MSLESIYGDWRSYNDLAIEALHGMSPEELAYDVGEIAVLRGIGGRRPIDRWPPRYHTVEATRAREGL